MTDQRRVEEALREEIRIVETLNRVGATLAAQLDLESLVQAVTDAATELTRAQFGAFFYNVLDDRGESYTLYALSGAPRAAFAGFPMPRNTAVFGPTFRGDGVVRSADITRDPRYGRNPPHLGMPTGHLPVRSYLAAPVISRSGEVLGGLFFGHEDPGVFTERDERLAVGIAAQAAIAIDNARLYGQALVAEARYRAVFEGVADAILVADAEGRYLDANPAAVELLGYRLEEWRRLRVADVVAAAPGWAEGTYGEFVQRGTWQGELDLRRKDGSLVPVEARATAVELPTGTVYLSAVRDISGRRALERMQRNFLAAVSHELRTPLTAIKGFAQLLLRRGVEPSRTIQAIVGQADRLQRLTDDLLQVSRLEAGGLPLRRAPTDLVGVVHNSVEPMRLLSEEHEIRVEAPDFPIEGRWDGDRVGEILTILLSNAIRYSPGGGAIRVRVEDLGAEARVSVADRGVGIAPAELPRVFDRFYRVEAERMAGPGVGLGLYIAKTLVEAHGGRITAESAGPRSGSTFSFTLPKGEADGASGGTPSDRAD